MNSSFNFWAWFFKGNAKSVTSHKGILPGYRRILNYWMFVHSLAGVGLAFLVTVDVRTAANTVLLPLASILVGLSFAWAGNAQALLQSPEVEEMTEKHPGGFSEYVFCFQLAILVIIVTMVLWGLAGLGVFESCTGFCERLMKALLLTMSSLTLRVCWHVVLGAQWLLLARRTIRKARSEES
jgi:hypothetical protein